MAPDLTAVNDHPANLIQRSADADRDLPNEMRNGMHVAAETLRSHERTFNIVFAALEKDALAEVIRQHTALSTMLTSQRTLTDLDDLMDAVRDLLGLAD